MYNLNISFNTVIHASFTNEEVLVKTPKYKKTLSGNTGPWYPDEQEKLEEIAQIFQCQNWPQIAKKLGTGRNGKQCREHYISFLDPSYYRGPFTVEESAWIIQKVSEAEGQHTRRPWAKISQDLAKFNPEHKPRVANAVKNHFNAMNQTKRRLLADLPCPNKQKMLPQEELPLHQEHPDPSPEGIAPHLVMPNPWVAPQFEPFSCGLFPLDLLPFEDQLFNHAG